MRLRLSLTLLLGFALSSTAVRACYRIAYVLVPCVGCPEGTMVRVVKCSADTYPGGYQVCDDTGNAINCHDNTGLYCGGALSASYFVGTCARFGSADQPVPAVLSVLSPNAQGGYSDERTILSSCTVQGNGRQ